MKKVFKTLKTKLEQKISKPFGRPYVTIFMARRIRLLALRGKNLDGEGFQILKGELEHKNILSTLVPSCHYIHRQNKIFNIVGQGSNGESF